MRTVAAILLCIAAICLMATKPVPPPTPVIVYEQSFLSQTSALPSTAAFTPTANGLYRWNVACSGTGGMQIILDTDFGYGAFAATNQPGNLCGVSWTFEGLNGVPITFDTRIANPGTSYDVFLTLEQLQ